MSVSKNEIILLAIIWEKLKRILPKQQIEFIKDIISSQEWSKNNVCFFCDDKALLVPCDGILLPPKLVLHDIVGLRGIPRLPFCDECLNRVIFQEKKGKKYKSLYEFLKFHSEDHFLDFNVPTLSGWKPQFLLEKDSVASYPRWKPQFLLNNL